MTGVSIVASPKPAGTVNAAARSVANMTTMTRTASMFAPRYPPSSICLFDMVSDRRLKPSQDSERHELEEDYFRG
jgi:hypothetical protein